MAAVASYKEQRDSSEVCSVATGPEGTAWSCEVRDSWVLGKWSWPHADRVQVCGHHSPIYSFELWAVLYGAKSFSQ